MIHSRLLTPLLILLLWMPADAVAFGPSGGIDSSKITTERNHTQDIKILIAYQSKYGSTKQYAEWIQKESSGDLIDIENQDAPDFATYDILIIGSSVRIGGIVIAPFIREHWSAIKDKKLILFTTSGTPPQHPKIQSIYEKSLPGEMRKAIQYFPLHGRISGDKLTVWDRFLMAIGKTMEQDETLKKDMGKDFDGVRQENLLPLLKYLKEVKGGLR
jgi:menaquinone-dependent protoporphyrinogen IX oxidase